MKKITYREAVTEALREEMKRDERVYLLGEDIGEFGGSYKTTVGLLQEFGKERVRNTPISEAAIVGAALGSALLGMRPVAELMYIDFSGIAMDQIANQTAKVKYMFGGKAKVPVVIRTQGGTGRSSAAQHAQSLEAWFVHVPGLKVVMPSTAHDVKGLLKAAIRDDNPVLFIEHKLLYATSSEIPEEEYLLPLGKADIKRRGRDVTVVATSRMVHLSLAAADRLAAEGIECEVVDPMTLSPLDEETILASVGRTNKLVVVSEAAPRCSFASEVAAVVAERGFDLLDAPIQRVTSMHTPMPFAPKLEKFVTPSEDKIIAAVKKLVG
ncbi:MAG: alpha-ketoacid dehydrogenase subunit beta [Candidatus Methylomirabilales bacterium]